MLGLAALATALTALGCGPSMARFAGHHHHPRPFRGSRLPYLLNNSLAPSPFQPAAPQTYFPAPLETQPPAPMAPPRLDYGPPPPPLAGGMTITVTKLLSDKPDTDNEQRSSAIARPKQAAERLAACWAPPVPPRGDTVEITIRFGFDKNGSVVGAPRITYVKAAPGMSDAQVRDSIAAAIKTCTPMHFTASMAANIPGYPLAVRFIGRRAEGTGERH